MNVKSLIPRSKLFGNADVMMPKISPNGNWISYLAPDKGVINLWLSSARKFSDAKVLTHDKHRGIPFFDWAFTNQHLIYIQDQNGDENWQIHVIDIETAEDKNLTPIKNVNARIVSLSPKVPTKIVVGLNNRDPQYHDLYSIDIQNGEMQLLEKNEQGYAGYVLNDTYTVRLAHKMNSSGGITYYEKNNSGKWVVFMEVPYEDSMTTNIVSYDSTDSFLYTVESQNLETAALFEYHLKSGQKKLLAQHPKADLASWSVSKDPQTLKPEFVIFNYDKFVYQGLGLKITSDLTFLKEKFQDFTVASKTLDNKKWIVLHWRAEGSQDYYQYDRDKKELDFLVNTRKELEGYKLAKMHPVHISSRDGLNLVSYLTLPPWEQSDRPTSPQPMVLLVHGGPWGRDIWGFSSYAQLLANRGYVVLSVNFRGSTGFGKAFVNAADKEWAGKMHDDLLDAVDWAINEKIADPSKIAIMGSSYGGYATLVGLTFTPDVFACGVDIVGPSNLVTLLKSNPPYWAAMKRMFEKRIGEFDTEAGQKFLNERSPVFYAQKITKPLLIGQGANDPRVKQAEADQIVEALKKHKIPVIYVLYPDEGHGFRKPENNLSFIAITETFLSQHLGGRAEPLGTAFEGSSLQILEGKELIDRGARE